MLKLALTIAAASVYFTAAYWLQVTYEPPKVVGPGPDGEKHLLHGPFKRVDNTAFGFAFVAIDHWFAGLTADKSTSPILLYENDILLGPNNPALFEINKYGQGRYSHGLYGYPVFIFSASDNTDPRSNGRHYWAVKPAR